MDRDNIARSWLFLFGNHFILIKKCIFFSYEILRAIRSGKAGFLLDACI
jgi:hypothetical protein